MLEKCTVIDARIETIIFVSVWYVHSLEMGQTKLLTSKFWRKMVATYFASGGNVTSYANIDGESGLKRTSSGIRFIFIDVVCLEIEYPRETPFRWFVHQQNL